MALTRQQIEQYRRDGFILVDGLFSPDECAGMKDEVSRIVKQARLEKPDAADNGVFVGLTLKSELFRRINGDDRMADILVQVIGPNVEFWSDKVVFKSAGVDFGSPWHQDWQYWKGAHKLSVWMALDDATPENGCLKLIPGSHHSPIDHGGEASDGIGFGQRMKEGAVDESRALTVPVAAGGAVFFHDLALHSSLPNTSGKDRWALISTFRDASLDDEQGSKTRASFMVRGVRTGKLTVLA